MKVTWELRDVLVMLATALVMGFVFSVFDIGARLRSVSESTAWQALPWLLLLFLVWFTLARIIRYFRQEPKQ